jgi:predicted RNA-binding Zn ribbon-like protein
VIERTSGLSRPFELIAGHPALDFVNTLDWRFRESGAEELLLSYDHLVHFARQSNLLSAKQAQRLRKTCDESSKSRALNASRDLREAIAGVLYATAEKRKSPTQSIRKLDKYFKEALLQKKLVWNSNRIESVWADAEYDPRFPLWLLSSSASDLMTSDAAREIRTCDNAECRWMFLDTSKSHTRRWCDMKICGNRMKARRFKAQRTA